MPRRKPTHRFWPVLTDFGVSAAEAQIPKLVSQRATRSHVGLRFCRSYTYYRPDHYQRYNRALEERQGPLTFAGEHTMEENGFMNAARGERAANRSCH